MDVAPIGDIMTDIASSRSKARLLAVQALYQHTMRGGTVAALQRDFASQGNDADISLFCAIIQGVVESQEDLKAIVSPHLVTGWAWERMDSVLRVMLYAAVWELWQQPDLPTAVVIKEYLQLADLFDMKNEAAFLHRTLDAVAKILRS